MKTRSLLARYMVTAAVLTGTSLIACAQDKVSFATNWRAQPAHGGFYQAQLDGTYKKYGLVVDIQQGGPQVNNRPMLPAGKIDFLMTGNMLQAFDNNKQKVPTVVVAAMFQKDPQAIIAHPGQGFDKWSDLTKAKTVLIGKDGQFSFWQWMKPQGFRDEQLKPYNYSLTQFLADKQSVQQGFGISEPTAVEKQGGFKPVVHLLADNGWSTYSTVIETRQDLVNKNPDLVRRFVEASIIGWYNYLYGDNKAANAEIKKINPDIDDENIGKEIALMKSMGIVDSGDALKTGIGTMTDARMKDFYDKVVAAGLYKPGEVNLASTYTTQFVNKGIGLPLRKQLVK
jgi:NitT/TauT family transport system substrate-binding protein